MTPPQLSMAGAIDLSALQKPAPQALPEGAFECDVPEGCHLVCMGPNVHQTLSDCLDTCVPYVERYLQTREAAIEVAERYHEAVAAYRAVLEANVTLSEEKDRLAADLREARRGTPAAAKGVLEGADELAASMKARFGTSNE